MLNKEKYADEIIKYALQEKRIALRNGIIVPCDSNECEECDCVNEVCGDYIMEWLNSEYVEPTVDWSKVPIDTPILVRDEDNDEWSRRYFAGVCHGRVYGWDDGKTSWSVSSKEECTYWEYAMLAKGRSKP